MFKLVILFCALGLPPAECDERNAVDVAGTPERFATPFSCLAQGQAIAARSALADPGKVEPKITCPRVAAR